RFSRDWSSDVCSSDLGSDRPRRVLAGRAGPGGARALRRRLRRRHRRPAQGGLLGPLRRHGRADDRPGGRSPGDGGRARAPGRRPGRAALRRPTPVGGAGPVGSVLGDAGPRGRGRPGDGDPARAAVPAAARCDAPGRREAGMIRAAGLRDLDTLESIERASFGADAWSVRQLREELTGDRIVLADMDEFGVRGYTSIRVFAPDAELMRIGVGLGSRRQGVGSRLLTAIEEAARRRGCDRMLLEVASDNTAAAALYRRAGYRETGRRRRYYRSGADAVLMERDLTSEAGRG